MDELPPEEEACVLWRHAARSRVGKEKEGGETGDGVGGREEEEGLPAACRAVFFFRLCRPPATCVQVQPPSISGGGLGLAGAGRLARGGQTRCRQRHDSPDRPLRLPTAFLQAWVVGDNLAK